MYPGMSPKHIQIRIVYGVLIRTFVISNQDSVRSINKDFSDK